MIPVGSTDSTHIKELGLPVTQFPAGPAITQDLMSDVWVSKMEAAAAPEP